MLGGTLARNNPALPLPKKHLEELIECEDYYLKESVSLKSLNDGDFEATVLLCETSVGDVERVVLRREDTSLSISNGPVTHVSLDPVASISPASLRSISLAANLLTEIDLSALSLCAELESLCINGNQLKSIHLEPLARCPKLEKLWLHNNELLEVNLEPLSQCPSFRSLYLENNMINHSTLNLEPLSKCKLLKSLRLSGNELNGAVDVTPLLECHMLSVFTYSSTTSLTAVYQDAESPNRLPPALRKRSVNISWKESKPQQFLQQETGHNVPYEIGMVGFPVRIAINAEALLGYDSELEISRIKDLDEQGLQQVEDMDVVLVLATEKKTVVKLRSYSKILPIIIVGPASDAEAAGSCLRHGANVFLREPLSGVSTLIVKKLAEKYKKHEARTRCHGTMHKSSSTSMLGVSEDFMEVDFEKIRTRYLNRTLSQLGRCHLEEPALMMLFSRVGGSANLADFDAISSLCGLPACAAEAFFRAVRGWIHEDDLSGAVTASEFTSFWKQNIQHVQAEVRLFNVLRRKGESRVRTSALKLVLRILQQQKGLCKDISVDVLVAVLSYFINGKLDGYSLSEAKHVEICRSLISAETNVFSEIMGNLTSEKLNPIEASFSRALGLRKSRGESTVTERDLQRLRDMRCPLTEVALGAVFATYCRETGGQMDITEFARFFLACSDCSTTSAVNYFFNVLDTDLDGTLSAGDLAPFYWEKGREGFPVFWSCIKDMTGCDDDGVSARGLRLQSPSDRAAFLRTVVFRDEDNEAPVDEWHFSKDGA